jgi:hypothetical protein
VTSSNGFAGSVSLSCGMTTSTAAFQPSCAVSPSSVTVTAGGTGTATVTISSTVAQGSRAPLAQLRGISPVAPVAFAAMFLLLFRRRKAWATLAILLCGVAASLSLSGCSGGGGGGGGSTTTPPRSSAGSYVVTVTGSGSGISSVTTTFNVTIN